MKSLYVTLKIIIAAIGLFCMFLTSIFWLGTEEMWHESVNKNFWKFFLGRLALTFVVGVFFLSLSFLVSIFYCKKENKLNLNICYSIFIETILTFIVAVVLVSFRLFEVY